MATIKHQGSMKITHCERCGTLRVERTDVWADTYVPKLVGRCRVFAATLGPSWGHLWVKLGIAESVNLPGRRFGD
jgi:hypothetical protein